MNNELIKDVSIQGNVGQSEEYIIVGDKTYTINKLYNPNNGEMQYVAQIANVVSQPRPQSYLIITSRVTAPENLAHSGTLLHENAILHGNTTQTIIETADTHIPVADITSPDNETYTHSTKTSDALTGEVSDHSYSSNTEEQIILNEQQCEMLEKKGWILLSVNNRIYKLDAHGLHDITDDPNMLLQCRDNADETPENLKEEIIEFPDEPIEAPDEAIEVPEETNHFPDESTHFPDETNHDSVEIYQGIYQGPVETYTVPIEIDHVPEVKDIKPIMDHAEVSKTKIQKPDETFIKNEKEILPKTNKKSGKKGSAVKSEVLSKKQTKPKISKNYDKYVKNITGKKKILRVPIKTGFKVTQIPSTICLGKMTNGKKLYARIKGEDQRLNVFTRKYPVIKRLVLLRGNFDEYANSNRQDFLEHGAEIELALEQAMNVQISTCTVEDISASETIVANLLDYAQMRDAIQNRNLIITKLQRNVCEKVTSDCTILLSFVVAGRVIQSSDDTNKWHFIFMPDLLGEVRKNNFGYESFSFEISLNGEPLRRVVDEEKEIQYIVHIHISEITYNPECVQTIVTVTRRDIPLKPVMSEKIEIVNEVARHACSSCAAKFTSEKELVAHQKESCSDPQNTTANEEDTLTVDTQKGMLPPKIMIDTEGIKYTACPICETKFTRTSNYRRHLSTHYGSSADQQVKKEEQPDSKPKELPQPKQEYFKCKMCSATYIHAPTLSRHILKTHIKALGL